MGWQGAATYLKLQQSSLLAEAEGLTILGSLRRAAHTHSLLPL